jgi:hypothetical protein
MAHGNLSSSYRKSFNLDGPVDGESRKDVSVQPFKSEISGLDGLKQDAAGGFEQKNVKSSKRKNSAISR